jgi:hypothetical protein
VKMTVAGTMPIPMQGSIRPDRRAFRTTFAVLPLLWFCACDSGPTSTVPGPVRDPILSVTAPSDIHSGVEAVFAVSIEFGQEPFSLDCAFGGGAEPNQIADRGIDQTDSVIVVPANVDSRTTFPFTFVLTSAYGATDTFSGTYTVLPALIPNHPPVIDSAVFGGELASLRVTAGDEDGDPLTITLAVPDGVSAAPLSQTVASGTAAEFALSYSGEPPAAGYGDIVITATDPGGLSITEMVAIPTTPPPGPEYEPDSIYAIAQSGSAVVGEPVRIVVITGVLPNPFQYLNGVRVTAESGADFVAESFNVGALGGAAYEADGLWGAMSPLSFVEPPSPVNPAPQDIGGGRVAFDFGLAPAIGGNVADASGELFNFSLTFSAPGTYTLGFQAEDGPARTFYGWEDAGGIMTTLWTDTDNAGAGIANSIVVSVE